MRLTGRVAARGVFDEHALDALARNVRQLVLIHEVTLAFFDFGASARALPNGRVATSSEQRMRFIEPSSPRSTQAPVGAGPHCRVDVMRGLSCHSPHA